MREVREFSISGQPTIYVEITDDERDTEYQLVSRSEPEPVESFEKALDAVRPAAEKLMQTINGLLIRPEEVEIEFGIKLSGKVGALIASTSTEGHFNVKLKWQPGKITDQPG